MRLPNTDEWHRDLAEHARSVGALVVFEATGGQEWRLWAALDAAGIATRQLPPAQIKAFAASRGTRARTDRIDAELIARFMVFRPDAGRSLPHVKLRLLRALALEARATCRGRKAPSGTNQSTWEIEHCRLVRGYGHRIERYSGSLYPTAGGSDRTGYRLG
ncbi:IS110 family transposase [Ruegeria marisflavi]|uniref:IS110 family transposase n=1 Tax=Ruegeria marisflavi TaxID=2984152 RepID=UPI0037C5CFAE